MAKPVKLSKETHNHFPLWQQSSGKRQLFLAIAAIAIGAAGAYGAIGFLLLIDAIQLLVYGAPSETVYQRARELEWWHRLIAPALGGAIVGIFIHYFLRDRRPHGIADVMQATISRNGNLGMRNGVAAAAVSAASIGVGASVGREGPVVHLLASVASSTSRLFKLDKATKITLIGCGAASAIAASFNAPIAGAFFALEVIIGDYGLGAFAPVVISSVVGTTIARVHIGDFPAFVLQNTGLSSYWEIPLFLVLGCICALVAVIYMSACIYGVKLFKRIPGPRPLVLGFGGLMVGGIAVFFPGVIGVGYETTNLALNGGFGDDLIFIIMLMAAKMLASVLSFRADFGGGVFSPSLCIGALVGAVFGLLIAPLFPETAINPAAYSVVAMGAVAGAVLGPPISTFLMIFELTRNFNLTIAVMLSTVLSSLIIWQTVGYSFFIWQLKDRGLDVAKLPSADVRKHSGIPPNLIKPAPILYKGSTETISHPINRPDSEFFITDRNGILKGLITKDNISTWLAEDTNNDQNLRPSETIDPSSVLIKETTLEDALNLFDTSGLSCLPVVESAKSMRLVGVLYHEDALLT